MEFAVPADHRVKKKKKEKKKTKKYVDLARELKTVEHVDSSGANHSWYAWNGPKRPEKKKKNRGIGNQTMKRDFCP